MYRKSPAELFRVKLLGMENTFLKIRAAKICYYIAFSLGVGSQKRAFISGILSQPSQCHPRSFAEWSVRATMGCVWGCKHSSSWPESLVLNVTNKLIVFSKRETLHQKYVNSSWSNASITSMSSFIVVIPTGHCFQGTDFGEFCHQAVFCFVLLCFSQSKPAFKCSQMHLVLTGCTSHRCKK